MLKITIFVFYNSIICTACHYFLVNKGYITSSSMSVTKEMGDLPLPQYAELFSLGMDSFYQFLSNTEIVFLFN